MAAAMGGYLAGRLRAKWDVPSDESFFRDTAHGFLAWAVATLVTAAVLSTAIGTILNAGVVAGATVGGAAAAATSSAEVLDQDSGPAVGMNGSGQPNQHPAYSMDSLFRLTAGTVPATPSVQSSPGQSPPLAGESLREAKREIAAIFINGLDSGQLQADDASYAGQLVAQRTGLSPQDAEARVNDVFSASYKKLQDARANAKDLADEARKNAAYASLWIFISLLTGAFIASLMAAIGGRHRDLF